MGRYLADQLLLPMALTGGGEFITMPVTQHFISHVSVIEKFLNESVVTKESEGLISVSIR